MKTLIDRDELYKALAQWDWQDLYLPVHFKELVDELPAQRSYEDGVRKGYEDAVRHYAKLALKQWTPITSRPMTAEERKEWSEKLGYDVEYEDARIYEPLPDDGEEVIVCRVNGVVCLDTFYSEPDGCFFDSCYVDDVVAWMPKPEPYKEAEDVKQNQQ